MFDKTINALLASQTSDKMVSSFYVHSDMSNTPIKSVYMMEGQAYGHKAEKVMLEENITFEEAYSRYQKQFVPALMEKARAGK